MSGTSTINMKDEQWGLIDKKGILAYVCERIVANTTHTTAYLLGVVTGIVLCGVTFVVVSFLL